MILSDAVSPQAADVVDNNLSKVKERIEDQFDGSFHSKRHIENGSKGDKEFDKRSVERRSGEHQDKFNHYSSGSGGGGINSSDIESDLEKDDLSVDSPGGKDYRDNRSFEYQQRFTGNLNPYSAFGAEETRLRLGLESAQFKERLNAIGIPPFGDETLHRRYSLQESSDKDLNKSVDNSNQPSSPDQRSLQGSPVDSYKGSRSIHDISFEDQDTNSFLPSVKEGLFFCHLCSFSGSTQEEFDQHMSVHFEHICPHCDYKSRTEGRLKRHIKDFHTEDPDGGYNRTMPGRPKVFRCKQCDYSTTDKVEFWTHSRSHIKEDKLLQCPRCPFVTEYKHHLEYHLRNHFGSKPFKCPKCNYACVNKSMLNSHMKSHTNVYQYRCADCTYATKYCHSLKLHLRKYNHKPAAVLNSDGSLPQGVDATASGVSLMAKRGPPRGPRGPRKDKLDQSPTSFLPMPPSPMGPLAGLPTMMSPFWPLMHGQMPGRLPHPLNLGSRFNPQLGGFPGFGMKSEEMKSPPTSVSSVSTPYKCNLCSFSGTSREMLTSHIVKVHASDNQDLFSMFGLSSEALLEEGQKRINALNALRSPPLSRNTAGNLPDKKVEIKKEVTEDKQIPVSYESSPKPQYSFMNGKYGGSSTKDEGIDILKQMTLKFGSGPVDLKRKYQAENEPIRSNDITGDSPLDLTKPRQSPLPYQTGYQSMYKNDDNEGEHSSGENSVYSSDLTSPTPRKRSRKGKAFKLDTLCMKLQEKQGNTYGSDEDSGADVDEIYSSDLLPIEADVDDEYNDDSPRSEVENSENNSQDIATVPEQMKSLEETRNENGEDCNTDKRKISDNDTEINNTEVTKKSDDKKMSENSGRSSPIDESNNADEDVSKNDDDTKSLSPPPFPFHNKRKPVAAAIQRGADIAWKILNDPKISDPSQLIKNGDSGHKLELSALDKKLWLDAPECTKIDKGDYECPHCQIAFGDCIMYTMHMGYHGYKDPYKCNMCGDTCKDRVEFFLHIARAAHN
ncbi:hypothetical protein ACF0H5_022598 [Mactra antiquata]